MSAHLSFRRRGSAPSLIRPSLPSVRQGLRSSRLALVLALAVIPAACGGTQSTETVPGAPSVVQSGNGSGDTTGSIQTGNAGHTGSVSDSAMMAAPHGMDSAYGRYLAGRQAQFNDDTAGAADNYQTALRYDPNNPLLIRRAWFFLLAEGRMTEAIDLARQAMQLDPDSTVSPLVVAIGQANDDQWSEALVTLKTLEPVGLNSFLLPLSRAWIEQGRGRTDAALAALDSMKAQPHLMPLYNFHAGMILDLAGRPLQAWPYYAQVLGTPDDTVTLRAVQVIADFLRRNGRAEEGEALFSRYRNDHQGSELIETAYAAYQTGAERPIRTARDGLAEALYGSATSVAQTQSYDTAQAFVRLALLLRPDFPYAEMMVGDLLSRQGRFADAAVLYAAVPAGAQTWFPVRLKLAQALQEQGDIDGARTVLNALATQYPASADPLTDLGELERRQKNWDAAAAAYQKALDLLGAPRQSHWPLYYSLGIALERGKRWPEAEKALKTALMLEKDQPMVLNYLGYSWIDRGMNLQDGKALIERAVAQRPNDGFIVDSLGWALYLMGDYPGAVRALERAIVLEASDPTINDHLGDALWQVGRELEARFQWQRALDLKPEPEDVDAIRRKLTEGLPAGGGHPLPNQSKP